MLRVPCPADDGVRDWPEEVRPASESAEACSEANFAEATLARSRLRRSSSKPASSIARRPARPPVRRASSVAWARRRVMGPGSFSSGLAEEEVSFLGGLVVAFWDSLGLDSGVGSWLVLLFVSGLDLDEVSAAKHTREDCDNVRAERVEEIGLLAVVRCTARSEQVQSMGLKLIARAPRAGIQGNEGYSTERSEREKDRKEEGRRRR